jgi:hypothetical protein
MILHGDLFCKIRKASDSPRFASRGNISGLGHFLLYAMLCPSKLQRWQRNVLYCWQHEVSRVYAFRMRIRHVPRTNPRRDRYNFRFQIRSNNEPQDLHKQFHTDKRVFDVTTGSFLEENRLATFSAEGKKRVATGMLLTVPCF